MPFTHHQDHPKAIPLGNRPIMQLVIEECVAAGIEEIIIVATPEGKPIYEDYFNNSVNRIRKQLAAQGKEDRYEPVQHVLDFPKISVIEQDPSYPYGNGSPIASARPFIHDDEAFIVAYSDDVVRRICNHRLNQFSKNTLTPLPLSLGKKFLILILVNGIIDYDPSTNVLRGLVEKLPTRRGATSNSPHTVVTCSPQQFLSTLILKYWIRRWTLTTDAIAKLIPTQKLRQAHHRSLDDTGDPKIILWLI